MDQTDKPWYGSEVNVYSDEWQNPYYLRRLSLAGLNEARKAFEKAGIPIPGELLDEFNKRRL